MEETSSSVLSGLVVQTLSPTATIASRRGASAHRLRGKFRRRPHCQVLCFVCFEFSRTARKGNQMFSNMTRFESLLEAVPDALVGMDQEGVIRFVNRQTELLFGYDRDELVGRPIKTLVPESGGRSTPSTGRTTSQTPGLGPLVWICS